MMNIGLHDRSVDAEFLAILQSQIDRCFHHELIDCAQGLGCESVKSTIEGIVFGHRLAEEVGEAAQGISVGDAFAQFTIVPVLDAHKNEGAQDLGGSQSAASGGGVFETTLQIAAHLLDHRFVLVEKVGDGLQMGLEENSLFHELYIRKTDLWD